MQNLDYILDTYQKIKIQIPGQLTFLENKANAEKLLEGKETIQDLALAVLHYKEATIKDPAYTDSQLDELATEYETIESILKNFSNLDACAKMHLNEDYQSGVALLISYARRGYAKAQSSLGLLHRNGWCGIDKDEHKSLELYNQAALKGDALGLTGMGFMYHDGLGGLAPNIDTARQYYIQAEKLGSALAINNLACLEEDTEEQLSLLLKAYSTRSAVAAYNLVEYMLTYYHTWDMAHLEYAVKNGHSTALMFLGEFLFMGAHQPGFYEDRPIFAFMMKLVRSLINSAISLGEIEAETWKSNHPEAYEELDTLSFPQAIEAVESSGVFSNFRLRDLYRASNREYPFEHAEAGFSNDCSSRFT